MTPLGVREPFADAIDAGVLPRLVRLEDGVYGAAFHLMKLLPAKCVLKRARDDGLLAAGTTVVETTSGTYGLGLAMVCSQLGLPLILVGDPAIDGHLRRRLESLGARVSLVGGPAVRASGVQQARLDRVARLRARYQPCYTPGQYDNPQHADAYGPVAELVAESFGHLDALVCPVGSGSSSTGIGGFLRMLWPELYLVGVDTPGSVLFAAPPGARRLRGLGNGLVPGVLDHTLFDEVHWLPAGDAFAAARQLYAKHALFMGPTSGAAHVVARWWSSRHPDARVLAVMPDEGHRYQGTVFHQGWLRRTGLADVIPPEQPIELAHPSHLGERWSRYAWRRRSRAEVVDEASARGIR